MSQLPGAANATIADNKITQYLLNPAHAQGAGKANFFTQFGFSPANWTELKRALLDHACANLVTAVKLISYGDLHEVSCSIKTPDGRNPCIISVWLIKLTDPNPIFVTAYPNPQGAAP
jgi:hypothetical protein